MDATAPLGAVAVPLARPRPRAGQGLPWRSLLAAAGPGWLVAVGYIDPGNWATDVAGGSAYGFMLLWTVIGAGLGAMVLQILAARLGLATGRDLATCCAEAAPAWARVIQWLLAESAICACDLAELIGAAIALKLLFHLPIVLGVALTAVDSLAFLALHRSGRRGLDVLVGTLVIVVAGCLAADLILARPDWARALDGLAPSPASLAAPGALYMAMGVVGATVMPHNLYLHSHLVRRGPNGEAGPRSAAAAAVDTCAALAVAVALNAAILVVAASIFRPTGAAHPAQIQDAYRLLQPTLGAPAAALFAVALLAAGQSATVTATLAGQVVMQGFVRLELQPWVRKLLVRLVALGPALAFAALWGEHGLNRLLIGSQVMLALQLPFAMVPLLLLTSNRRRMGALVSPWWLRVLAWAVAAAILALSLGLLFAGRWGV
jgi:manganese transport protein